MATSEQLSLIFRVVLDDVSSSFQTRFGDIPGYTFLRRAAIGGGLSLSLIHTTLGSQDRVADTYQAVSRDVPPCELMTQVVTLEGSAFSQVVPVGGGTQTEESYRAPILSFPVDSYADGGGAEILDVSLTLPTTNRPPLGGASATLSAEEYATAAVSDSLIGVSRGYDVFPAGGFVASMWFRLSVVRGWG